MVNIGLLVLLDAKPDKVAEVEELLKAALPIVQKERETVAWFAFRFGPTSFGIFDGFSSEAGRQAHLAGEIAKSLMAKASDLFSQPPEIKKVDILANKLPT